MKRAIEGRQWEREICAFLEERGMTVLDTNYTIKGGEIDIVAKDGDHICFVEVKYRSARAVDAYSSVGYKKQRRIIKCAERYLLDTNCSLQPRFDVAFVFSEDGETDIEYIENAYDGSA